MKYIKNKKYNEIVHGTERFPSADSKTQRKLLLNRIKKNENARLKIQGNLAKNLTVRDLTGNCKKT